MTKQEKEDKIADLKKKAANKSLPASAVKKLEEMIAKLESESVTEKQMPESKFKDGDKVVTYWSKKLKNASKTKDKTHSKEIIGTVEKVTYREEENIYGYNVKYSDGFILVSEDKLSLHEEPKTKVKKEKAEPTKAKKQKAKEDTVWVVFGSKGEPDSMQISEEKAKAYISRRPLGRKGMTYKEMSEKAANKLFEKPAADYDCDELIEKEKARKASAKKSAKKADATPTAKKDEKAAEKLGDRVKKHYKEGELTKAQIKQIIEELQEQIKELQELLKTAKPKSITLAELEKKDEKMYELFLDMKRKTDITFSEFKKEFNI